MRQRRAVIVGAGIAGLASALALSRSGWRVALLEQRPRFPEQSVVMLLWESGVKALRQLGIDAKLDLGGVEPDDLYMRDHSGAQVGHVSLTGDAEQEHRPIYIRQDRLFDALLAKLGPDVELHNSTAVSRVDLMHLAAGDETRRWDADFLVAADGTRSTIRPLLERRSQLQEAGAVTFQALIPPHRAPRREGDSSEIYGPNGKRFCYASLGHDGAAWMAVIPGGLRPESRQIQHELLNRWFDDWPEPVGEYLDATRPEELVQGLIRTIDPLPSRLDFEVGEKGGALLMGDSASGVIPSFPLGATVALEDAATLGWALHHYPDDLNAALRQYHEQRIGRIRAVHRFSRRHLKLGSGKKRLLPSLVRATPDRWLAAVVRNLVSWELPDDMWWTVHD
ncbi:FAD-dependent oxidoreductase [Haloglycomyces albus]|uniref:FAD-dependent oxidoreductase n=1 Tax=Haloglycomyces albus TaxID=526067 RepID=UPI00046CEE52|nr:NAD(P)/FAD-dependent oxidoreductase [Haloglycomyces albus]